MDGTMTEGGTQKPVVTFGPLPEVERLAALVETLTSQHARAVDIIEQHHNRLEECERRIQTLLRLIEELQKGREEKPW